MKINPYNISFYFWVLQVPFLNVYLYHSMLGNIINIPFIDQLIPMIGVVYFSVFFLFKFRQNLNRYILILFFFILYLFLYASYHYIYYTIIDTYNNNKYFIIQLFSITQYLFFFFLGFYFRDFIKYKKAIFFIYFILAINILLNVDIETYNIVLNTETRGIYLLLGDTFAIWSILTLSYIKTNRARVIVTILSVLLLFTLVTRTSFFVFLATLPLLFLWTGQLKKVVIFLLPLSILLVILIDSIDLSELSDIRMLTYFITGEDMSLASRSEYTLEGINSIKEFWFTGDYGGDVLYHKGTGYYMHNILQLLRQYGFIPFFIFLFFCVRLFVLIFFFIKTPRKYDENHLFFILVTTFSLIEILFARTLGSGSAYIFFSIGVLLSLKTKFKSYKEIYNVRKV